MPHGMTALVDEMGKTVHTSFSILVIYVCIAVSSAIASFASFLMAYAFRMGASGLFEIGLGVLLVGIFLLYVSLKKFLSVDFQDRSSNVSLLYRMMVVVPAVMIIVSLYTGIHLFLLLGFLLAIPTIRRWPKKG